MKVKHLGTSVLLQNRKLNFSEVEKYMRTNVNFSYTRVSMIRGFTKEIYFGIN